MHPWCGVPELRGLLGVEREAPVPLQRTPLAPLVQSQALHHLRALETTCWSCWACVCEAQQEHRSGRAGAQASQAPWPAWLPAVQGLERGRL